MNPLSCPLWRFGPGLSRWEIPQTRTWPRQPPQASSPLPSSWPVMWAFPKIRAPVVPYLGMVKACMYVRCRVQAPRQQNLDFLVLVIRNDDARTKQQKTVKRTPEPNICWTLGLEANASQCLPACLLPLVLSCS